MDAELDGGVLKIEIFEKMKGNFLLCFMLYG